MGGQRLNNKYHPIRLNGKLIQSGSTQSVLYICMYKDYVVVFAIVYQMAFMFSAYLVRRPIAGHKYVHCMQ